MEFTPIFLICSNVVVYRLIWNKTPHMPHNLKQVENRLWSAADNLRANSPLSSHEYSSPVLVTSRTWDCSIPQGKRKRKVKK